MGEKINTPTYPSTSENGKVLHDSLTIFFKFRRFDQTKLHSIPKPTIIKNA